MKPELSAPERRYLLAACVASPLYAFRARAVGRLASFADGDTDAIVSALARAGLVQTSMERNAQLTEQAAPPRATSRPTPAEPRRSERRVRAAYAGLGGACGRMQRHDDERTTSET